MSRPTSRSTAPPPHMAHSKPACSRNAAVCEMISFTGSLLPGSTFASRSARRSSLPLGNCSAHSTPTPLRKLCVMAHDEQRAFVLGESGGEAGAEGTSRWFVGSSRSRKFGRARISLHSANRGCSRGEGADLLVESFIAEEEMRERAAQVLRRCRSRGSRPPARRYGCPPDPQFLAIPAHLQIPVATQAAGIGRQVAGDNAQERGLSRAVFADQAEAAGCPYLQANLIQHALLAERLADVLREHRRPCAKASWWRRKFSRAVTSAWPSPAVPAWPPPSRVRAAA